MIFAGLTAGLKRLRKNPGGSAKKKRVVPRRLKVAVELIGLDVRAKARTLQSPSFSAAYEVVALQNRTFTSAAIRGG
jgi:hypothetical protein